MAALDAHERREFVLLVGTHNVICGICHGYPVRMAGSLPIDAVNQVESAPSIMSFEFGLYPDGKELGPEVPLLDFAEVYVAVRHGSVLAQIKVFIEKTLRRIGMSINNNG